MTQLMKTIGKVQRQLNPNLKIDGVLLTLADMRTKLASTIKCIRRYYSIFKMIFVLNLTNCMKFNHLKISFQNKKPLYQIGVIKNIDIFFSC